MYKEPIVFNPEAHTLEYMRMEWGITRDTLLYKRMKGIGLNEEDLAHALWVAVETCPNCHNDDVDCQCENDE